MYVYILYSTYILIYCWYIMTHNDTEWRYIYVICMHGRWNEIIYVFMFIACANKDPPLSVVKISAITDFEATHAKQGYRYRVIPYHSYIYIYIIYIYCIYIYIYIYCIYTVYIYIYCIYLYIHTSLFQNLIASMSPVRSGCQPVSSSWSPR